MERIQALINRLQDQVKQNADIEQMQVTVQLLQAELTQLQRITTRTLGTSKVAVVLPTPASIRPAPVTKPEPVAVEEVIETPKAKSKQNSQLDIHFDPMNEIPTFSQYKLSLIHI